MSLRIQKFVPIDRDYPIYEIINDANEVLLDVSRTDSGDYELMCHKAAVNTALDLDTVLRLISQARALLAEEEPG